MCALKITQNLISTESNKYGKNQSNKGTEKANDLSGANTRTTFRLRENERKISALRNHGVVKL